MKKLISVALIFTMLLGMLIIGKNTAIKVSAVPVLINGFEDGTFGNMDAYGGSTTKSINTTATYCYSGTKSMRVQNIGTSTEILCTAALHLGDILRLHVYTTSSFGSGNIELVNQNNWVFNSPAGWTTFTPPAAGGWSTIDIPILCTDGLTDGDITTWRQIVCFKYTPAAGSSLYIDNVEILDGTDIDTGVYNFENASLQGWSGEVGKATTELVQGANGTGSWKFTTDRWDAANVKTYLGNGAMKVTTTANCYISTMTKSAGNNGGQLAYKIFVPSTSGITKITPYSKMNWSADVNDTSHAVTFSSGNKGTWVTVYHYLPFVRAGVDTWIVGFKVEGTGSFYVDNATEYLPAKIVSFSTNVSGQTIAYDHNSNIVHAQVPAGTNLATIVPTFTKNASATIESVNGKTYTAGNTVDFTDPVAVVINEGTNQRTYSVSVTTSASPLCRVTSSGYTHFVFNTNKTFTGGVADSWVTVSSGQFRINGSQFKMMGATNYSHSSASNTYIDNMLTDAKAAGMNVIRVCDMLADVYSDQTANSWQNEDVWEQTDYIIATCDKLGLKVLMDLFTFKQYLYERTTKIDAVDPAYYYLWDNFIDFVTSRVNTITGETYGTDSTIFAYSIMGEPVPYGGALNTWSGGVNSSRDVNYIVEAILHVAQRLNTDAPNQLVSAGGILHFPSNVLYGGVPYYQYIWASPYIDFASSHIYPDTSTIFNADGSINTANTGEWLNLSLRVSLASSLGKPFLVEEFGIDRNQSYVTDLKARNYFTYCYQTMNSAGVRDAIFWNLGYGRAFDVGPQCPSLWNVMKSYVSTWGTTQLASDSISPISPFDKYSISSSVLYQGFEDDTYCTSDSSDPGYVSEPVLTTADATQGTHALKIPLEFDSGYQWFYNIFDTASSINISGYDYLAMDIYQPINDNSVYVRMSYYLNGDMDNCYNQGWTGEKTNFTVPGQWRTIYVPLTNVLANQYSYVYDGSYTIPTSGIIGTVGIELMNCPTIVNSSYILVDNIRLVNFS